MVENMLERFFPTIRLELLVGVGFSVVGFSIGSLLIGNILNSKIQLDSPKEISEPKFKPYFSEFSPGSESHNVSNPKVEGIKQSQKKDQQSASSSPADEFTSLSQEEKNCVIWKNAYPEASYKLKQGDACY